MEFLANYVDFLVVVMIVLFAQFAFTRTPLSTLNGNGKTYAVLVIAGVVVVVYSAAEAFVVGSFQWVNVAPRFNSYFIATSFYELVWKRIFEGMNSVSGGREKSMGFDIPETPGKGIDTASEANKGNG